MIEATVEFFNQKAQQWDSFRRTDMKKIATLVDMIGIQPGYAVLDAGCGTGILLPFLKAAVGDKGAITAIDSASQMVERAVEKNRHLAGIRYITGDINEFIPDTAFDLIVCLNFFPHVEQKEQFVARMKTILNEKGTLVIMHDISRQAVNSIHQTNEVVKNDHLPECSIVGNMIAKTGFEVVNAYESNELYFIKAINVRSHRRDEECNC